MIPIVLAAVLLLLPVPPPAEAATSPLLRAVQAPAEVAYRGEQIITTWLGGETQTALVRIEHDPPDWTRLEYRPIGLERRWVILRRGEEETRYDPATRRGTRLRRNGSDDEADDVFSVLHLPLLQANYLISSAPGTFLERPVDRVTLRPKFADRPTRRIDVDRATGVVLRSERFGPDGRLVQLTAFLSFDVLPRGWSKTAAPPRNLQLSAQPSAAPVTPDRAARRLGVPPVEIATPPGFQRVADYLLEAPTPVWRPTPAWQTVYSDGLTTLLVSRHPGALPRPPVGSRLVSRPEGPVWYLDAGVKHVIHWAYEGWRITMVGEVSPEGLLAAAARTGIAPPPRLLDRLLGWLHELGVSFRAR